MKKYLFICIAALLLLALAACSSTYNDYYREGSINPPSRSVLQRRSTYRSTRSVPTPRPRPMPAPRPVPTTELAPETATMPLPTPIPAPTPIIMSTKPMEALETPAPAPTTPPQVATTTAKRELASHQTTFELSDEGRATNINKASSTINNHVVNSGETFSYNETVGPTIERRGYKEAVIFVEGEKEKGFGGGVCQVSTTLAIAADNAGMTITERHDHSRPVSYAQEGDEAATSYGGIDFKFKNEKPHPVIIHSKVEGGTITVTISEA